jgi:hypothetical protein
MKEPKYKIGDNISFPAYGVYGGPTLSGRVQASYQLGPNRYYNVFTDRDADGKPSLISHIFEVCVITTNDNKSAISRLDKEY